MFVQHRGAFLSILASLTSLGCGVVFGRSTPDKFLAFLSVGQGDCTVLRSDLYSVMIDAAPRNDYVDAGERLVRPALDRLGVGAIDLLILTHPDMDHIGGMKSIAASRAIGRVVVPACFRDHALLKDELYKAGLLDKTLWIESRARVMLGEVTIELVAPVQRLPEDDNEGSIFVRIANQSAAAVITGDASTLVEDRMREAASHWSAQLLKAGHHGSRTSTSVAWVDHLRPSQLIVSCGRNNRYGHPHKEVMNLAQSRGIPVYRTDQMGDLVFRVGTKGFERISR